MEKYGDNLLMSTKQAVSGLLVIVVIVSLIVGGLAGYEAAQFAPKPTPPPKTGIIGPYFFLVTYNDTTPTRAFNTTYQNLQGTGQPMLVTVIIGLYATAQSGSFGSVQAFVAQKLNSGGNGISFCDCYSTATANHYYFNKGSAVSTPSYVYNNTYEYGMVGEENATTTGTSVRTLQFWVPSLWYYMVNDTHKLGPVPTITGWDETIPPTGFGAIIAPVIQALRRPF